MSADEFRPPIVFLIFIETDNFSFHFPRKYPVLVWRREAGFHHKKIVSAIAQQTPDEMTSGKSCLYSRARAASTVADKIQSCAMFIITNKTRRACQTAVRPLVKTRRVVGTSSAKYLFIVVRGSLGCVMPTCDSHSYGPYLAVSIFDNYLT